jgi:predicted CXXCH cytochrome family protein
MCLDCHRDKHNGQFAKRLDRGDCASCHTLDGFDRWKFDVKAHASTRYPLAGKHADVACEKCHARSGNITDYHPKFGACADCHKDPHAGQFLERYQDKCDSCHDVVGFMPATFTLLRHRNTRFELAGAHVAAACTDCHKETSDGQPHQYLFQDRSCIACHRDPHDLKPESKACETCHTLNVWTPARTFDHSATSFPLLGSHRSASCISCHKPANASAGKQISFKDAPQQCSGCHEDIHAGQFAARFDPGCSSCHSATTWKPPAGFDHSRSAFPLDGAHRKVRCVLCHTTTSRVNGRETLVYKDAPTECAKCH